MHHPTDRIAPTNKAKFVKHLCIYKGRILLVSVVFKYISNERSLGYD